MFAHSYSEKNHELADGSNALMYRSVFSGDEMTQWGVRSGAGSVFHVDSPATAKLRGPLRGQSVTDCPRRWNDEIATHHSRTQAATTTKVAPNWLTHVRQVTGC